jgi:hypothetical protein
MKTETKKQNFAPSYEELEILNECYNKTRFLLDNNIIKEDFFYQHHNTNKEFLKELKKDLQNVIKSLHFKHMDNEFNK